MKFRQHDPMVTDADEQKATQELRQMTAQSSGRHPAAALPPMYWSNLIVRTNERIDHATSGKAISISWAVRVALPGVVAMLFFFIGLHYYYVPQPSKAGTSLTSVFASLPPGAVDSLLADPTRLDASLAGVDVAGEIFLQSREQISDYLVSTGDVSRTLELMTDDQVQEVLSTLGSRATNL